MIVVRFETIIGKQEALQGGSYHFDNKPFIVKERTNDDRVKLQQAHIVQEGWKVNIDGCMMYNVVRILKLLKKKLRALHSQAFQNVVSKENDDRVKLQQAQIQPQMDPNNVDYQKLRVICIKS